ncbi:MAG: universal stress protein [Acidobacteriia bacterium]|nr:universal stress protein [Terriglobia bacterium]
MLTSVSQRLIEFKRIAVLTDLESNSEKMVRYAASLARWYGSELLLVHAYAPESSMAIPSQPLPVWPASGLPPKQDAEQKIKALTDKLNLHDLRTKAMIRETSIGRILDEVDECRPSLLVLATHGREGVAKWLVGSIAEEVFRRVQWPVLILGPGCSQTESAPQKQFERVLYATDMSAVSLTALQYASGISHDHEAQLIALYVEPDPKLGFSFNRVMAQQKLEDWLQDHIDGMSAALIGAHCLVDVGKPGTRIVEVAAQQQADLVVIGARGLGGISGPASHFIGGTAYEISCCSKCPVLIVPQPR